MPRGNGPEGTGPPEGWPVGAVFEEVRVGDPPEGMISDPVEIGIGTPEPIPEGRLLTVAVGFVGGEGKGMRIELDVAIGVFGGGRDEVWGDTGPKPGMLIGKHFASSGWLVVYL